MAFTKEQELKYEAARRSYLETQRRKSELSKKDKQLLEQLELVEIGNYDVSFSTALTIANVYQNNAINAFSTIFRLGFLKGMRKAQKEIKNGKK